MESSKSTKRALLTSALALLMCVTMLVGATFAWFTDTVSTGVNKIQAGNLDIKVEYRTTADGNWQLLDNATDLFGAAGTLFEPGHTRVVELRITNAGNLALKYKIGMNVVSETAGTNKGGNPYKLSDYLKVGTTSIQQYNPTDQISSLMERLIFQKGDFGMWTARDFANFELEYTSNGNVHALEPGAAQILGIKVYMPETVGNEANAISTEKAAFINFGLNVVATQYTVESDSFGTQYDKDAPLDFEPVSTADELKAAAANGKNVQLTQDVTLTDALTFNNAVTIDLNGKTLTSSLNSAGYSLVAKADATIVNGTYKGTGSARGIGAYGNLTMRNVTVDVAGQVGVACSAADRQYTIEDSTIKGGYALCNFNNNATINVSNSTLEGKNTGFYHNGSNSGLNLTVTGTKINAGNNGTDATGVYISGSTATRDAGGYQKASFTDCTVKGNAAIEVKYTDLTLNNCTVTATVPAANASYTQNNNGSTTNGFAVVSTDNATNNTMPKPEGTITINGGSYTGLIGLHSFAKIATDFPGFVDTTYVIHN
ncbi:MAG: hypothetical protein EGQ48_05505 [Clostridiales bacterium]|nr:hypothetical protein [Clostridiales bacterium]